LVFTEIEKSASAILIHMGVQDQALLDILTGSAEPSALLPFQMPADMKTVEEQFEDVPRDMKCYTDSEGNHYDFAFGLNWCGVINDDRVKKYK
jgi:beta-glucosidase